MKIWTLLCHLQAETIYNARSIEDWTLSNPLRSRRSSLCSRRYVWDCASFIQSKSCIATSNQPIFYSTNRAKRLSTRLAILGLENYYQQWLIWQKHNAELYMEQALRFWEINHTIWHATCGLWVVYFMKFVSWNVHLMVLKVQKLNIKFWIQSLPESIKGILKIFGLLLGTYCRRIRRTALL